MFISLNSLLKTFERAQKPTTPKRVWCGNIHDGAMGQLVRRKEKAAIKKAQRAWQKVLAQPKKTSARARKVATQPKKPRSKTGRTRFEIMEEEEILRDRVA